MQAPFRITGIERRFSSRKYMACLCSLYIFLASLFSLREQPLRRRFRQHTVGTQWGKDSTGLRRRPRQNEVETQPQRLQLTAILVIRCVDTSCNQAHSQALLTQRGWRLMKLGPKARLMTSTSESYDRFMKLNDWIITHRFVVLFLGW